MKPETNTTKPTITIMEMIDHIEARGYIVITTESIAEIKTIIDGWT